MSAATQRPDEAPLNVFLVEHFDGIRVQIVVTVSSAKLARVRRDGLPSTRTDEDEALAAAHQSLHVHAKRAVDDVRGRALGALDCYVEQLEACERRHADEMTARGKA